MGEAFLHIWPYLLVTIPLAVAVNMSGASKYIKRAFDARPITAILLATIVGAFSPFCSCGVIPVIAALLISGVPLAPVMSFWIASPSMDPEIFFLSVGTIGWNLALWRLIGTLLLSLSAGFITHFALQKQWIGTNILRNRNASVTQSTYSLIQSAWRGLRERAKDFSSFRSVESITAPVAVCCDGNTTVFTEIQLSIFTAALLGVPTYTNNLSALPMVSGLLAQGMSPAAALAFLIAGPTTTLPAMAAVWSLVSHRVFVFYISFALVGAIVLGYVKFIIS
jgi:uncharacterized membrane protein YraQ (UPF0718 family)